MVVGGGDTTVIVTCPCRPHQVTDSVSLTLSKSQSVVPVGSNVTNPMHLHAENFSALVETRHVVEEIKSITWITPPCWRI